MTWLAAALVSATAADLEATRRLLHRAGANRRRLGIPMTGQLIDDAWPPLLAAICLDLSDELTRRRGPGIGRCVACLSDIALYGIEVPPDPGPLGQPATPPDPVPSEIDAATAQTAAAAGGR